MQELTLLPPLSRLGSALFLDFDGTLAELAPQPEAVRIADDLVPLLAQLSQHLHGALAVVSGRPMGDLDRFLAPLQLPTAAEHGAHHRLADGRQTRAPTPALDVAIAAAGALAHAHSTLRLEVKTAAVALHYRHAPELEALCLRVMTEAAECTPGVELLRGKCVLEIKPAGVSKGTAIEAFMAQPPFAGRLPLFAGDDTTDEDGFRTVQRLGGHGIKVGDGATLAHHRCATPALLRQWLRQGVGAFAALRSHQAARP